MERKDRDKDIAERRAVYQVGAVAITNAIRQFKDLTGIDVTDCVDTSGRHVGEAPYLKITAERLAEISEEIEDAMNGRAVTALKAVENMHRAPVLEMTDYRGITSGPVLSAYRPVPTS